MPPRRPLDANLRVGSGIYLAYSEHISAIPIEKGRDPVIGDIVDMFMMGLLVLEASNPLPFELRKLPCWTNPSRGGTCRRTKEWGGWDASKIDCGGGCYAFCAARAGAEPAGCAAGAGSGH